MSWVLDCGPVPLDALDAVLPLGATAPSAGREHARAFARECGHISAQAAENTELLVSELVTNAVRAACGAVRLSLRRFPGELLIEVTDHSPRPPVPSCPSRESENGRGLLLVEALSQEWGWSPLPDGGKRVYCRLAIEA